MIPPSAGELGAPAGEPKGLRAAESSGKKCCSDDRADTGRSSRLMATAVVGSRAGDMPTTSVAIAPEGSSAGEGRMPAALPDDVNHGEGSSSEAE